MSEFTKALESHLEAVRERDIEAFSSFLHPSHNSIVILPNGTKLEGYEDILGFHKEWFKDTDWRMDVQTLDVFSVDYVGYALLDVTYHDIDQEGKPYTMSYYLSLLFEKIDDRWILLRDQNTLR
ncbi:MAG: nuclear transport factor 2 family protein [Coriobacteriia bacterium]|nr:nuclear transport factor 2 family protein [Coriobacteriia bacterium]MCL2870486.1 nuclear transport factor 2 family protein [Coriobacteriia bacterium]